MLTYHTCAFDNYSLQSMVPSESGLTVLIPQWLQLKATKPSKKLDDWNDYFQRERERFSLLAFLGTEDIRVHIVRLSPNKLAFCMIPTNIRILMLSRNNGVLAFFMILRNTGILCFIILRNMRILTFSATSKNTGILTCSKIPKNTGILTCFMILTNIGILTCFIYDP